MSRTLNITLRSIVACVAILTAPGLHVAASAVAADLFQPANTQRLSAEFRPLHASRFRPVVVNMELLQTVNPGAPITVNLFDDVVADGHVVQVVRRSPESWTVSGTLGDQLGGTFVIVVESDVAAATFNIPSLYKQFQLRYREGMHLISEMDPNQYPPCKGSVPVTEEEAPPDTSATGMYRDNQQMGPSACTPLQPVFDILVLYTPLARQAAGGTNAINAICQLAIEESNQAYLQSQIDARMRLVYRAEIGYAEGDGYDAYLNWVKSSSTVSGLRDLYGADFVSLLVDDSSYCGLGQCYNGAYTTCAWHCATGYYSFCHEIGHNQGCDHDRENAGAASCSVYGYSYGWRFNGTSGTEWRTIMAYAPGTRIQYFSNPYVFYDGVATGVPAGETNQSYNALSISNKISVGEAKRISRFDVWVDFAWGGTQTGAYANPFSSAAAGLVLIDNGVGASELPTLHIKTGSSAESLILNKRMIVRSCGGSAVIGRAVVSQ